MSIFTRREFEAEIHHLKYNLLGDFSDDQHGKIEAKLAAFNPKLADKYRQWMQLNLDMQALIVEEEERIIKGV